MPGQNGRQAKGKLLRVSDETHARVARLTKLLGQSHREVVERAVADLERRRFLEDMASAFEDLARDEAAFEAYRAELAAWDVTVGDALARPDGA